jgi:hypothetical protein
MKPKPHLLYRDDEYVGLKGYLDEADIEKVFFDHMAEKEDVHREDVRNLLARRERRRRLFCDRRLARLAQRRNIVQEGHLCGDIPLVLWYGLDTWNVDGRNGRLLGIESRNTEVDEVVRWRPFRSCEGLNTLLEVGRKLRPHEVK